MLPFLIRLVFFLQYTFSFVWFYLPSCIQTGCFDDNLFMSRFGFTGWLPLFCILNLLPRWQHHRIDWPISNMLSECERSVEYHERREIFRWFRGKKHAIHFLQGVHCTKEKEALWSSEWGYSAIFSSISSASAAVSILFNNNLTFQILKSFSDLGGRFNIKWKISEIRKEPIQILDELDVKNCKE